MFSSPTVRSRYTSCRTSAAGGFTLIEMLVVMAVILIMCLMSFPLIKSTMAHYDLQSSVAAISGTINSTRYRAISEGVPYKLTLSKSTRKYQLANSPDWDPTNPDSRPYSNVGTAVPFGQAPLEIGSDTAIEFFPSGKVSFSASGNSITLKRPITDKKTATKTLTVTTYGSVKVE